MKRPRIKRIDVNLDELKQIIERADISDDDRTKLLGAVETLAWVTRELEAKRVSIRRLRKLLFGVKTEKLSNLLGAAAGDQPQSAPQAAVDPNRSEDVQADPPQTSSSEGNSSAAEPVLPPGNDTPKKKRKGHGRHGAADYTGANKIYVPHESLKSGDPCPLPECTEGKVYPMADPAVLVRIRGQAPIGADVISLARLRCNACGEVFTAQAPGEIGPDKYDATAGAMVSLFRYGTGMPFNRLEQLQAGFGIPLPAGTQWELVHGKVYAAELVHGELMLQAAQSDLIHNDDTTARILALEPKRKDRHEPTTDDRDSSKRVGIFTTSIVAINQQSHRIALFFTGRRYAGENLALVLAYREREHADGGIGRRF